jgi:hypothetical protein
MNYGEDLELDSKIKNLPKLTAIVDCKLRGLPIVPVVVSVILGILEGELGSVDFENDLGQFQKTKTTTLTSKKPKKELETPNQILALQKIITHTPGGQLRKTQLSSKRRNAVLEKMFELQKYVG